MHYKNIVIDGHNDTMMKILDEDTWLPKVDIGRDTDFHIDLKKLEDGGLNAPLFAAFSEGYYKNIPKSLSRTLSLINALYWTEANNENFIIASDLAEIENIYKSGKIAAIPSIEGAYFIDENNYKDILIQLKSLGIKLIGFNWNFSNNLGEGVAELYSDQLNRSTGGLTELGIKTLKEMERLGIGIDVSHMNEETFIGVADNYEGPIIATHSNVYELTQHRRNLKDYQIERIKDSGGLVGLTFASSFIKENQAKIEDYIDHIDYMVDLIGIDHVAIGSDFDGADLPEDLKDSSEIYKITDELISRGYSETNIKKILGLNYLRVFKKIEDMKDEENPLDICGKLNIKMGEKLKESTGIKYRILDKKDEEIYNYRIILDGILEDEGQIKEELEYSLKYPNEEFFHIITLEIRNSRNMVKRETRIIYNSKSIN